MHRDAKLGLALGILVIGFAGAFCFPRHAGLPARAAVADPHTDSLTQHLALRDVRVYTSARHPDEIAPVPPVVPTPVDATAAAAPAEDADSTPVVSGAFSFYGKRTPAGDVTASPAHESVDAVEDEVPVEVTYTVRPGDTLSSIAQKHLGSSGRYSEVFETNRELLGSPDALQIGMVLRIPPRERAAATQVAEGRPDHDAQRRTDNAPPAGPPQRFRSPRATPPAQTPPTPPAREPQPTLAEPMLPTTAIPAPRPVTPPPPPSAGVTGPRFGAASVGASLRGARAAEPVDPVN